MILVTGATGCLGSALVTSLVTAGEHVVALRLPSTPPPSALTSLAGRIEWRIGDVRDATSLTAALKNVTRVYHLAGIAAPFNRLRAAMTEVNVRGTARLAELALAHGVERFVYTSSSAAVGIPPDGMPANETLAYNGDEFNFSYMESKRRAEDAVRHFLAKGLPAVIVNPTAVMAPGGDVRANWCGLVDALARRRIPFVPSGGVAVVTEHDMVDGHLRAMAAGRVGERYILNTVNITYRDLVNMVADVVGVAPPRLNAPPSLLRIAGAANSALNLLRRDVMSCSPLTWEYVPLLTTRIYYDQSKAVRELGLSQTSLRTAVERVYAWWLATSGRQPPKRQAIAGERVAGG